MNMFVTGCDSNTEWQLPWFLANYKSHTTSPIMICDFGMSEEMQDFLVDYNVVKVTPDAEGWFKKPFAILEALNFADKVCWIDTDCQIKGNPDDIFLHSEPNKLSMVEDRPWSNRRPDLGKWYNSGVVMVERTPYILKEWAKNCLREANPVQGDQEVLHMMMGGDELTKLIYINPLPHKYNTLRIDYIDGIADKNPVIVHHTGRKGKDEIRRQIDK